MKTLLKSALIVFAVTALVFTQLSIGFAQEEENEILKRHREWLARVLAGTEPVGHFEEAVGATTEVTDTTEYFNDEGVLVQTVTKRTVTDNETGNIIEKGQEWCYFDGVTGDFLFSNTNYTMFTYNADNTIALEDHYYYKFDNPEPGADPLQSRHVLVTYEYPPEGGYIKTKDQSGWYYYEDRFGPRSSEIIYTYDDADVLTGRQTTYTFYDKADYENGIFTKLKETSMEHIYTDGALVKLIQEYSDFNTDTGIVTSSSGVTREYDNELRVTKLTKEYNTHNSAGDIVQKMRVTSGYAFDYGEERKTTYEEAYETYEYDSAGSLVPAKLREKIYEYETDGTLKRKSETEKTYENGKLKESTVETFDDYTFSPGVGRNIPTTGTYAKIINTYAVDGAMLFHSYDISSNFDLLNTNTGSITISELIGRLGEGDETYDITYDVDQDGNVTYTHVFDAGGDEMAGLGGEGLLLPPDIIIGGIIEYNDAGLIMRKNNQDNSYVLFEYDEDNKLISIIKYGADGEPMKRINPDDSYIIYDRQPVSHTYEIYSAGWVSGAPDAASLRFHVDGNLLQMKPTKGIVVMLVGKDGNPIPGWKCFDTWRDEGRQDFIDYLNHIKNNIGEYEGMQLLMGSWWDPNYMDDGIPGSKSSILCGLLEEFGSTQVRNVKRGSSWVFGVQIGDPSKKVEQLRLQNGGAASIQGGFTSIQTTITEYDALGRMTKKTIPDGTIITRTYEGDAYEWATETQDVPLLLGALSVCNGGNFYQLVQFYEKGELKHEDLTGGAGFHVRIENIETGEIVYEGIYNDGDFGDLAALINNLLNDPEAIGKYAFMFSVKTWIDCRPFRDLNNPDSPDYQGPERDLYAALTALGFNVDVYLEYLYDPPRAAYSHAGIALIGLPSTFIQTLTDSGDAIAYAETAFKIVTTRDPAGDILEQHIYQDDWLIMTTYQDGSYDIYSDYDYVAGTVTVTHYDAGGSIIGEETIPIGEGMVGAPPEKEGIAAVPAEAEPAPEKTVVNIEYDEFGRETVITYDDGSSTEFQYPAGSTDVSQRKTVESQAAEGGGPGAPIVGEGLFDQEEDLLRWR